MEVFRRVSGSTASTDLEVEVLEGDPVFDDEDVVRPCEESGKKLPANELGSEAMSVESVEIYRTSSLQSRSSMKSFRARRTSTSYGRSGMDRMESTTEGESEANRIFRSGRVGRQTFTNLARALDVNRHEEIVGGRRRLSITAPLKPSMTGYLLKRGSKSQVLLRRFFVLTGSMLANYPLRHGSRDRIASWQLCLLGATSHGEAGGLIVISIRGAQIKLCAESEDAARKWVDALNLASILEPRRDHLCPMPLGSRVSRFWL